MALIRVHGSNIKPGLAKDRPSTTINHPRRMMASFGILDGYYSTTV
nr:hypothetical protein [Candidatus Sigynarchaeota archaeon]